MRTRLARVGLCISLALAVLCGGQSPASARSAGRFAQIQKELDAVVRAGVPGVVFLVRDGAQVKVLTSGLADVAQHRRMGASDRFRIASISKPMVATAVLRMVAAHRLGLDDRVDDWLPGLLADRALTVRELLQHTSGLFDYVDYADWFATARADPLRRWQPAELLAVSAGHTPYFAPGTSFHYSNTDYRCSG